MCRIDTPLPGFADRHLEDCVARLQQVAVTDLDDAIHTLLIEKSAIPAGQVSNLPVSVRPLGNKVLTRHAAVNDLQLTRLTSSNKQSS